MYYVRTPVNTSLCHTTTTDSEWMGFGIEYPLIQTDNARISKRKEHVFQNFSKVKAW